MLATIKSVPVVTPMPADGATDLPPESVEEWSPGGIGRTKGLAMDESRINHRYLSLYGFASNPYNENYSPAPL
jgi:hypothetical protein